jgi:hypothetical protein
MFFVASSSIMLFLISSSAISPCTLASFSLLTFLHLLPLCLCYVRIIHGILKQFLNSLSFVAKVAVVDSGEVGSSAVYSRYNNGPRTLPWVTPVLSKDSSVYSVSTFARKCLHVKGF